MKYLVISFLTLIVNVNSFSQSTLPVGYPDRHQSFDVLPGFINPPSGYGEVPFYWWQGDTLTRERLEWQLNQLQGKKISSLQINYSHLDEGGLSYGLSRPSKPALFTDDWWNLFKWFAAEAQKRGMTVSLSDYTLGIGQGFSLDEAIKENSDLNGAELRNLQKTLSGKGTWKLPTNYLSLTTFKLNPDSSIITASRKNLLPEVNNGTISYDFGIEKWKIICVYPEQIVPSYDPMNPESGNAYCQHFFGKFEHELGKNSKALNFFFSDELNFRLGGNLWNKYFAKEFERRKGYELEPYLDALFLNVGNITSKIRIDYNDVIVALSEENFFKPVFQWHEDRGLIFGCDHGGRGREVVEFGDYFRTQRWNQGPGSDQPNLGKDIIKAKVASSIAHLYERPRVWLEGFYGSGWGTTSAGVTDAIFSNFVAGYNLLSFHGLYYSTQGGWWEWAPPCNHFRMPYWKQIDPLMNCVQRLSFLLSQGYHNCDVAILYPVEPVIADTNGSNSVKTAFDAGEQLYNRGIDFDFIDFELLSRSEIQDKEIHVSGEKYKVLVIPSMKTIRFASLQKIAAFQKAGGIVVNIGELPVNSDKNGANDPEVEKLVKSIFPEGENVLACADPSELTTKLSGKYLTNFRIISEFKNRPYVMHRTIGKREIYALYNFQAGTKCFFKAKGSPELWNPWNGETVSISNISKLTADGTEIELPLTEKEIQVIVFNPEGNSKKNIGEIKTQTTLIKQIPIGNTWEFELKPSLDNQWGDFQLPASNEMMGAQVRQFHFAENQDYHGEHLVFDKNWKNVTYSYGTQFLKLGALPTLPTEEEILKMVSQKAGDEATIGNAKYHWEEYGFSWKTGVEGDYGHQGYHGLKGEMYDNFIRLGKLEEYKHSLRRVPEQSGNFYFLYSNIIAPSDGVFGILTGDKKPTLIFINGTKTDVNATSVSLRKGANPILLCYDKACETYLVFRNMNTPRPPKQSVSMCWYQDYGVLPFDYEGTTPSSGVFAFESAPALRSFTFSAYGKIAVWAEGEQQQPTVISKKEDGLTTYSVNIKSQKATGSQVVINIDFQAGYRGAAAIPVVIKQTCDNGTIALGDWSEIDGLKSYSGGAVYRKTVNIDFSDLKHKLEIDLGDLVASAELLINGKSAGIKLSPPWKFDVTKLCQPGENKIEILIYNTLSNNYTTIPTRYRGNLKSGLIGPVSLNVLDTK